jgi:hypothetical protein
MPRTVLLHPEFGEALLTLAPAVQRELAALVILLEEFGPQLKRPRCDTLNGSKHTNMKELL